MRGTLHVSEDGRFALRFERRLAHPVARVWSAITDPEQLRAWFPAVVDFDLTRGAKLMFRPTPEQVRRFGLAEDGVTAPNGEVTQVDPPRLLEYTWDREVLRWELVPEGDAACRLIFTNTFDDGAAVTEAAAGWHAGLDVVEAQLNGEELDWSPWDRAAQLRDGYADLARE
jgi:uncharacterized protein YndB with AHSA1/START domain